MHESCGNGYGGQRAANYLLNDSISLYIWLVWQEGHSIKDELRFNCPLRVPTGV